MPRIGLITVATALFVGCAPPPEVAGGGGSTDPRIELIAPTPGTEITVDETGHIEFQIAVFIDNFVFDHGLADTEPTDGVGHFHVEFNSQYLVAPDELLSTVGDDGFSAGDQLQVRVILAQNNHEFVTPNVSALVELPIVAAPEDTGAEDTGGG